MGKSEEIIGMLLKETPEQDRANVILATKCAFPVRVPRLVYPSLSKLMTTMAFQGYLCQAL